MQDRDVVRLAFQKVRTGFFSVAAVSCVVNLLMLTGPIFMLQVYDRVLTSQSVSTLVALSVLAVSMYAAMGLFDFLRNRVLSRVSHWLDDQLSPLAFRSWIVRSLGGHALGYKPLQDLTSLRGFIASPTILALFDLPWFPIFLGVVYLLQVELGLLATAGVFVVVVLTLLNEWLSSRHAGLAAQADIAETLFAEQSQRNADSILSMGMLSNVSRAWINLRHRGLKHLQTGAERSEAFTASSKAFRMLLQSAILGYGAWLAIQQEISAGTIVAASIIAGRAIAPLDQTLGGWKMIKRAQLARRRLRDYLSRDSEPQEQTVELPDPQGVITFENVTKLAPGDETESGRTAILSNINFHLNPGDGLGIIGPSASGKSSLARLLVGLWMPDQGAVRIDGATFEQWDPDQIGKFVGYLPQQVELLTGTIAQNIARFDPEAEHEDVIAAAKLADVHEMILRFPDGYGTSVDTVVTPITGGQKQRIALARAVYKRPVLVVLDEPNSNLDAEGDAALARAITELRESGSVVVVMAHRPSAIAAVDKVLMIHQGEMKEFGEKSEVLRRITRAA